jgi:sterol desaturase/sphingolipid hydroxylase (fatty acid hydroxylase superfamily)
MDTFIDGFATLQAWLFESCVQPLVFALGFGGYLDLAFESTEWLLVGLVQIFVLVLLIGPLQRWRPVEAVSDKATIRTDMLYTLIHRLGLFRLAMFFTLDPWMDGLIGTLRVWGLPTFHLDDLWPAVTGNALLSFALYLVVFDFFNYWFHRAQHQISWWWKLHALHHAQRQMTMWSDNRNHLLDDVLRDIFFVSLALLIGVAPGQFLALVAFMQLSENLQHANVRLWFGRWGERLWVSPRFHRLHHAIGIGHENIPPSLDGKPAVLGGCNFGVLLPWWDMLFGTADFTHVYPPTGVRDQVEQGVDYGRGFWSQQWRGLLRLAGRA